MALPTEGFLLEYAPGRLVVGEGPLEAGSARRAGTLACYAPDFLLGDPAPWLHPSAWRETTRTDLLRHLDATRAPRVTWTDPDPDAYRRHFDEVLAAIDAGSLTKAVPVILERGIWNAPDAKGIGALIARALRAAGQSAVYAVWSAGSGMVGASPEILFQRESPSRLETVAMAGTAPSDRAEALTADPKELREHASVVDDIVAALTPIGAVTVGPREVVRLPTMAHLKTDIAVAPVGALAFGDVVRALHPTAALGAAPRAAAAPFLPSLGPTDRARFGAPFGLEWPDGRAHVIVAIRNIQWVGNNVTLGAGAGLIAGSVCEREWAELRLKRAAVKALLGL